MRFRSKVSAASAKGVYHGSSAKFTEFKGGSQGKNYGHGHYFTESKKEAKEYATSHDDDGYLYTVDLVAKKPYDPFNEAHAKKLAKILSLGWDAVSNDETWKDPSTGYGEKDKDNYYIKLANTLIQKLLADDERWTAFNEKLAAALKKAGFDSVHDARLGWWVVTDPKQVRILKTELVKYRPSR